MVTIKKESAWQFVTSSTGGVGIEFVAAEGGTLYFKDPGGAADYFVYGAAGAGLTYGFKLPKIGKLNVQIPKIRGKSVGGIVAPAAFPNAGKLYILDSFKGDELAESDIQGVCMFLEIGGGVIAGVSGTAMLVGMSPAWLAAAVAASGASPIAGPIAPIANMYVWQRLTETATGLLVMGGLNVGVQAGIGGAAFLGGLY